MAGRLFTTLSEEDFRELATELRRFADQAEKCGEELKSQDKTYETDGMNNVILGLDSLAKVMQGILGHFNVSQLNSDRLRKAIEAARIQRASKKNTAQDSVISPSRKAEVHTGYSLVSENKPTKKPPKKKG